VNEISHLHLCSYIFIASFLSSTLTIAQTIEIGKVYDKDLLYYYNSIVTIKVGLKYPKNELENLSNTEWYKVSGLNTARIETQRKMIDKKLKDFESTIFPRTKLPNRPSQVFTRQRVDLPI
jgi:hypothetical protein